ncbi:hypothetical protein SLA2020_261930 [Shorea laevis]
MHSAITNRPEHSILTPPPPIPFQAPPFWLFARALASFHETIAFGPIAIYTNPRPYTETVLVIHKSSPSSMHRRNNPSRPAKLNLFCHQPTSAHSPNTKTAAGIAPTWSLI